MKKSIVTLVDHNNGKTYEYPVLKGARGPSVIDIRNLFKDTGMFTPIFVIGRTVGWLSQWIEFKQDPTSKISRPRQLYTGE